jgi:hypothetical protein
LLPPSTGFLVFRTATLLTIVLFAAGPGAALFCRAWCDPQLAADGCHHASDGSATRVSSPASCQDAPGPVAARTETVQRGAGADPGVPMSAASFRAALATSRCRPAFGVGLAAACGKHSRSIPLRI